MQTTDQVSGSEAPAPTRAEEGRETLIARAINQFFANMMPEFHTGEYMADCLIRGPLKPLLSAEARAAQAEAEVARLTAALKVSDKKARGSCSPACAPSARPS